MRKLVVLVAWFLGVAFSWWTRGGERYDELKIFAKILSLIERFYVEPVEMKTLVQGAIKGMLAELDPHSAYMPEEKFREFKNETQGEFGGIGIEIGIRDGYVTIISPIEDTPAAAAGLKPLDRILAIDGQSTKNFTLMDASQKLKGKRGEKVTLTIQRGNEKPFDVTIVRGSVKIQSVTHKDLEPGWIYMRLSRFIETSAADMEKVLQSYMKKKKEVDAIVLDLRGNPGGLLEQAIKIADMFLPENALIVTTRSRQENETKESRASGRFKYADVAMIVLVDAGSASASEILAGALQDHKRALILGERSFGKGSVQSVIRLDDGGALKLTVARYYTPSGRSIQAQGIQPDLLVLPTPSLAGETGKTESGKSVVREKQLSHRLRNDKGEGDGEKDEVWYANDPALVQAVNYLKVLRYKELSDRSRPQEGTASPPPSL